MPRDDLLVAAGLLVLAAVAWVAPHAARAWKAYRASPPPVLYAAAPSWQFQWSPEAAVPRDARPATAVGGWRGLLLGNALDLNAATREDLEALPGVGQKLAAAILDFRAERGGFRSPEELTRVKGVGPATWERLRPSLTVAGPAGGPSEPNQPAAGRAR